MRSHPRRLLIALALALTLVGAGGALVASQDAGAKGRAKANAGLLKVAAGYMGIELRQLMAELRAGKSLARAAEVHGKTRAGLRQALLDAAKARLDARSGLTAERKAQLLERLEARIDRLLDSTGVKRRGKHKAKGGLLKAAAAYVELEPKALARELRAGRSLAQVAVGRGKTVEGLKAALLDAVRTRLDRLVAAGRLTPAQRDEKLAGATERIAKLVDRVKTAKK
ncbi:MAG: hypothetical protein ACRDN6_04085 [Gaiellaceae bacterium]